MEFGTSHATASMGLSYFSLNYSAFVWFAFRKSLCWGFCWFLFSLSLHISTFLAQVEFSFILTINIFNFKKSCVLSLVPETSLIASKNGLALQPCRHSCLLEVLFPAGPSNLPPKFSSRSFEGCIFANFCLWDILVNN